MSNTVTGIYVGRTDDGQLIFRLPSSSRLFVISPDDIEKVELVDSTPTEENVN